jgi:hypothetical protein
MIPKSHHPDRSVLRILNGPTSCAFSADPENLKASVCVDLYMPRLLIAWRRCQAHFTLCILKPSIRVTPIVDLNYRVPVFTGGIRVASTDQMMHG